MTSAVSERDGRRLRSERSRDAVVDAILELVNEGDTQPSAAAIADRAGVSLRSVFRHFDDMDTLNAAAVERHHERVAPLLVLTVPAGLPRHERIQAVVEQRAQLYEAIAPVREVAERQRSTSEPIAAGLARTRRALRRHLNVVFAPELRSLDAAERRRRLADIEAATSFAMWRHLRVEQGASVVRARGSVARLVRAVLADGADGA